MTAGSTAPVPVPTRADVVIATLDMLTRNATPGAVTLTALESALTAVYAASLVDDEISRDFRPAAIKQSLPHVVAYLHENHLITSTMDLTPGARARLALFPEVRSGVNAALARSR